MQQMILEEEKGTLDRATVEYINIIFYRKIILEWMN